MRRFLLLLRALSSFIICVSHINKYMVCVYVCVRESLTFIDATTQYFLIRATMKLDSDQFTCFFCSIVCLKLYYKREIETLNHEESSTFTHMHANYRKL